GADQQEIARPGRALRRDQLEQPAANADKEQRRADPQERGREEHVDRERERRVGVGVDDRREAGARREPPDEAADRERDEVEIEALPEGLLRALLLAERTHTCSDATGERAEEAHDEA